MDDDFLAEGGRDDVESAAEGGKTSCSTRRRIGSNQTSSPIRETPPPMTIRRGATSVMACTSAKAIAAWARARIDADSGSPCLGGLGDQDRRDPARVAGRLDPGRSSRPAPRRTLRA